MAEEYHDFVEDNRRFFTELLPGRDKPAGTPGGAGKIDRVGVGTPMAAAR